jgi:hypothetical protein
MRMRLEDARVADIQHVALGSIVSPVTGFSGVFESAMVIETSASGEPVRGLLSLDGQYRLNIFVIPDSYAVRVIPHTSLVVEGVDRSEEGSYDSAFGALTIRDGGGGPILRCKFHNSGNCYVELTTGVVVKPGDEFRESFLGWRLSALDANAKTERVVATGPTWKDAPV